MPPLFILLWLLLALGVGKRFPFELLGPSGFTVGAWTWGLVSVGVLVVAVKPPRMEIDPVRVIPFGLLLSGIGTLIFDVLQYLHFRHLGYALPVGNGLVDGALIGLGISSLKARRSFAFLFVAALTASVLHDAFSIVHFPLTALRSDMLDAIRQAGERILSHTPMYGPSNGGTGQLPYLPGTVAAYFPATYLGFDLRWMNIIYRALGAGLVWNLAPRAARATVPWIWIHPYVLYRHELYLEPFLFSITLVLVMIWRAPRTLGSSVSHAANLATLQWAWVFFPFIWLRQAWDGKAFRVPRLVAVGGMTSLALVAFLGYFLVEERALFFNAIFKHLSLMGADAFHGELVLGFGALGFLLGVSPWMIWAQAIVLLAFGVQALRTPALDPLRLAAPALLVFVLFLGFIENYFYLPVLWLLALI